jgi:hypothetical protein
MSERTDPREVKRRTFLRTGVLAGALLGGAALVGRHLSGYSLDGETARKLRALSAKEFLVLQAVARRILASDGPAPSCDEVEAPLHADAYLARLDEALRSDLRALLHLFEHGSSLKGRFTRMSGEQQDRVLAAWESSGSGLKRRGFQALKTLCLFGYWRDDRTWPHIGYSGPTVKRK